MAKQCPCGCGRALGFLDRRIAKNAVLLNERLEQLEHLVKPFDETVGLDHYDELVNAGEYFLDTTLLIVHGDVPAQTLDRAAMHRWFATSAKAVQFVRHNVPANFTNPQLRTLEQRMRDEDPGDA